eukprot:31122-Chlamydomonas_euryale.AAC.2
MSHTAHMMAASSISPSASYASSGMTRCEPVSSHSRSVSRSAALAFSTSSSAALLSAVRRTFSRLRAGGGAGGPGCQSGSGERVREGEERLWP